MLYKPFRTKKSSLSLFITSYFNLNIYIFSFSIINEVSLKSLFDKFLSHYIIFLEYIDTINLNQDIKVKNLY